MKGSFVIKMLLVLLVVTFLGHQIYSSVYKPIVTENAEYYEVVDGLNITGVIMRGEYLITDDTKGVYHYLVEDGARVASGNTVANIYDSESASLTMSEIENLTEQLDSITELQNYNNQQAANLDLANDKVDTALNELIFATSNGDYAAAPSLCEELLLSLNRRQIVTGEETDFSVRIADLQERLNSLKASLPNQKGSITAPLSGYFSTFVDGYENVLNCSDLKAVTVDFLDELKPQKLPENVIGKIVSDYEWYIAAKVKINDSMRYKVGDSLIIKTSVRSAPELEVKVAQINLAEDTDSAVVIFSCNQLNNELASMRTGPMTVVSDVHSGLKVSRSALRVVDSETGVYVVSGISLKFVKVNVLYNNDAYDFIICEQVQSNSDVLRLYDEVVVKGKKLYEGKIIA